MNKEEIKKEIAFILDHEERISSDKDWKYSELCRLIDKTTLAERKRCSDIVVNLLKDLTIGTVSNKKKILMDAYKLIDALEIINRQDDE